MVLYRTGSEMSTRKVELYSRLAVLLLSFPIVVPLGCAKTTPRQDNQITALQPKSVLTPYECKQNPLEELRDFQISQDGTVVLAIFGFGNRDDERLVSWNTKSGEIIGDFPLVKRLGSIHLSSDASVCAHVIRNTSNLESLVVRKRDTEEILLELSSARIYILAVSPDGKRLATYSNAKDSGEKDWKLDVWNLETGAQDSSLELGVNKEVTSALFSPDGTFLVVGFDHGEPMQVWNLTDQKRVARLWGHINAPDSLVFSTDGRKLASGGRKCQTIRVWDAATWQETNRLPQAQLFHQPLAFRDQYVLCLHGGQTVKTWDLNAKVNATHRSIQLELSGNTLPGPERLPVSPPVIPQAADFIVRMFQSKTTDGSTSYWPVVFPVSASDITEGFKNRYKEISALDSTDQKAQREVRIGFPGGGTPVFSPNGEYFVVFASRSAAVIDSKTATVRHTLELPSGMRGPEISAAWSPDGTSLAAVETSLGAEYRGQNDVVMWQLSDGSRTSFKPIFPSKWNNSIRCLAISPDGQKFALGTQKAVHLISRDGIVESTLSDEFITGLGVDTVAFLPDGQTVVGLNIGHAVYWNTKDGTTRTKHLVPKPEMRGPMVVMAPHAEMAATSSERSEIVVWKLLTGNVVQRLKTQLTYARGIALSRDGSLVVAWPGKHNHNGPDRPTIYVHRVGAQDLLATYALPDSREISNVVISPDNRILVSGEWNAITVWQLPSP
jgi:WD40 repeat protein